MLHWVELRSPLSGNLVLIPVVIIIIIVIEPPRMALLCSIFDNDDDNEHDYGHRRAGTFLVDARRVVDTPKWELGGATRIAKPGSLMHMSRLLRRCASRKDGCGVLSTPPSGNLEVPAGSLNPAV